MRHLLVAVMTVVLLGSMAAIAQDAKAPTDPKKPSSIFDFGGFSDDEDSEIQAPTTQPTIRDRKPEPGIVDPNASKPATPVTPKPVTPKPPTPGTPTPAPLLPPPTLVPETTKLLPVPDANALARAAAQLDAKFKPVTATLPASHLVRTGELLSEADAAFATDPVISYASLVRAVDAAVAARNVALAGQAADALVEHYDVDELSVRSGVILKLVPGAVTVADAHVLAAQLLPLIEAAVREDDYALAEQLTKAAEQCGARAAPRDSVIGQQVRAMAGDMRLAKSAYEAAKPALTAIAAGKGTPTDLAAAGRYFCLEKGNWARGLAMLAGSNDPKLQPLAKLDLSAATSPAARVQAADGWWQFASAETGASRGHALTRAADWYRQAQPDLTGAARDLADQRLATYAATSLQMAPGLVAEAFFDARWQYRRRIWVDPNISADYTQTLPDPLLDRRLLAVRWSGYLKVPLTATYRFHLKGDGSMYLWIDDQLIQKKTDKSKEVLLAAGFHKIRLLYKTGSEKRSATLGWTATGVANDQIIPASYLFHDVRAGAEPVDEAGIAMLGDDLLDRTTTRGGMGTDTFDVICPDTNGMMIGLRVTTGRFKQQNVIRAVQPVFRTSAGNQIQSRFYCGKSSDRDPPTKEAIARDGFAVGAITVRTAERVNALKIHFMRVLPTGKLDPKDQYESDWIGFDQGTMHLLGGDGRPVVGFVGGAGENITRIGLILRGQTTARPEQVISARWGSGDKWEDVTNQIRLMVRNGDTRIVDATSLEASPGRGKTLEITYGIDGQKKTIKIKAGGRLIIPGVLSN